MRPLEWCLVFAFLPLILMAFGPPAWRKSWPLFCIFPGVIALLQVVLEGWRWQFIPLYLLAAGIPLVALLRHGTPSARWARLAAGVGLTSTVLGVAVVAGWALPVITLPAPTGPYAVGVLDRELVDTARDRRLMATVWYPAAAKGAPAPLTHEPDALMVGLEYLTGIPGMVFQHMRYITVGASDGAPILDGEPAFPVLVFSHGLVGTRLQNASMLQELASWGYVVLALDHTDAAAVTVFPDGETRFYDEARFGIAPDDAASIGAIDTHMFPVWVADQRFAFDMIEEWAASDPLFAGKLNLDQLGAFGHSFGGATSLEACRVDTRCRAAADLDGGLYGEMVEQPAVHPMLLMTSASSGSNDVATVEWRSAVARAQGPALWLEVPGSSHLSLTDMELLSPLLPPRGFDPRAGLAQVNHDLRVFFDTWLRSDPEVGSYELPQITP
jgi:predicted dienelactone hydrolase